MRLSLLRSVIRRDPTAVVRALAFKIIIIENKQYDDEAMIGLEILNPCLDVSASPLNNRYPTNIDLSISIWKISIFANIANIDIFRYRRDLGLGRRNVGSCFLCTF